MTRAHPTPARPTPARPTPARLLDAFPLWLDASAAQVADVMRRLRRRRVVAVREGEEGTFSVFPAPATGPCTFTLTGPDARLPAKAAAAVRDRDVELALAPERFLLRPLELPRGAADFLDAIVRAQIDRLTPWPAAAAAYGWTQPEAAGEERIRLHVAAAPRAGIRALTDALSAAGTRSITVTTEMKEAPDAGPVRVHDEATESAAGTARIRAALLAGIGGAAALAALALVASQVLGSRLDADIEAASQQIAATRRALVADREARSMDSPAVQALERRKRELPPAVLVIDALARILPDDTYVTQLQLEGDKVQIAGVSRAAAGLVRLLEQSRRFAQATFVAPTTPLPDDRGERFQIEARVLPPRETAP